MDAVMSQGSESLLPLRAGQCSANNTCGSGPFPVAPNLACKGFNPEGADLGTLARCATNAYDNNGYLTLDFTCDTATCVTDGDCPLVRASRPLPQPPQPYTLMFWGGLAPLCIIYWRTHHCA